MMWCSSRHSVVHRSAGDRAGGRGRSKRSPSGSIGEAGGTSEAEVADDVQHDPVADDDRLRNAVVEESGQDPVPDLDDGRIERLR